MVNRRHPSGHLRSLGALNLSALIVLKACPVPALIPSIPSIPAILVILPQLSSARSSFPDRAETCHIVDVDAMAISP